jgi:hypothetical protein
MKKNCTKEYKYSSSELDSSFDVLVSNYGDGTILRAATFVSDLEFLFWESMPEDSIFSNRSKKGGYR